MPPRTDRSGGSAVERRAGLVLLAVLALGTGLNLAVVHPLRNYLTDFRGYYAAGMATRRGVNPYDLQAVRDHIVLPGENLIVRYIYPPPTLGLMRALSRVPYESAQVLWCLAQFGLLLGALGLMLWALNCPLGSGTSVLIGGTLLVSTAVEQLFHWGQCDALVLAFLAAVFAALTHRRSTWAGAALGLAVVAKVTPVLYLAVLVLRRQYRAAVVAVAMVTLLVGITGITMGVGIFSEWAANLTTVGTSLAGLVSPNNMSLHAYVYRALVDLPAADESARAWINLGQPTARLCALGGCTLLAGLTVWWMHRGRYVLTSAECLAAAIPVALLVSPVMWVHHGVQLLIPLALMTTTVMRRPRAKPLDIAWLVLVLVLLTNWPTHRFDLALPMWLAHLAGPTMTYAAGLLWLFMVVRFPPLKRALDETVAQLEPSQPDIRPDLLRNESP